MKKKIVAFVIPLLAAYILLAPEGIQKELIFKPQWITDLTQAGIEPAPESTETFPFRLGGLFGYISGEGELIYAEKTLYNAAIGDQLFLNFSNVPNNLIARDTSGSILFSIDAAGYPFIQKDRIFVISPEGNGISEWDMDGNKLWERWYGSIITAVDVAQSHLLIGLLQGMVELVDLEGKTVVDYIPENSRIGAVYGCAVSSSAEQIAVLSGLDPQRLTVLERREEEYKVIQSSIMDTEFRRTVYMTYSGAYLFIEAENRIYFMEPPKKWIRVFPIHGELLALALPPGNDLFFVLSRNNGNTWVQAGKLPGSLLYQTRYPAVELFTDPKDNSLYLGGEYTIIKLSMAEQ